MDPRYLILMRSLFPLAGGRMGIMGSDPWSFPHPEPNPRPPVNPFPRPNPEWPGGLRPPGSPKPRPRPRPSKRGVDKRFTA